MSLQFESASYWPTRPPWRSWPGAAQTAEISGAGATFPYPIYAKWAESYKAATGDGLNYQSIGSGGGIKQIKAGTVTFGASDKPLEAKEFKSPAWCNGR